MAKTTFSKAEALLKLVKDIKQQLSYRVDDAEASDSSYLYSIESLVKKFEKEHGDL